MPKTLTKKSYLLFFLCLISASVWAVQASPSEEFWSYMLEFDDDNGDVLDPLEYEELLVMKDGGEGDASEHSSAKNMEKNIVTNNQSTSIHASSMQSSSSVMMKGESL